MRRVMGASSVDVTQVDCREINGSRLVFNGHDIGGQPASIRGIVIHRCRIDTNVTEIDIGAPATACIAIVVERDGDGVDADSRSV
jgi:hypothetical protein